MKKLIAAVAVVGGSIVGLAATAGAASPDEIVPIETIDHPVITSTSIIGAQPLTTIGGGIVVTDAAVTVPSDQLVTTGPTASAHVGASTPSALTPSAFVVTPGSQWNHYFSDAPPLILDIAWTAAQSSTWHAYAGG